MTQQFLDRDFFRRHPCICASEMIGALLVWDGMAGRIVETEAYAAENDEACHTFARKGARDFVARHAPGTAYVYLNYGVHWLLNVLVKGGEMDGFVLIRALEPVAAFDRMRQRRKGAADFDLCSGPGKLTKALGITGDDHGRDLCTGCGRGFLPSPTPVGGVETDTRVGISKARELKWRYLLAGSRSISLARRSGAAERSSQ